jgi:hypothetical protein
MIVQLETNSAAKTLLRTQLAVAALSPSPTSLENARRRITSTKVYVNWNRIQGDNVPGDEDSKEWKVDMLMKKLLDEGKITVPEDFVHNFVILLRAALTNFGQAAFEQGQTARRYGHSRYWR